VSDATLREQIEGLKEIPANEQFLGHHQRAVEEILLQLLERLEGCEGTIRDRGKP
jgi:hypothetical protein